MFRIFCSLGHTSPRTAGAGLCQEINNSTLEWNSVKFQSESNCWLHLKQQHLTLKRFYFSGTMERGFWNITAINYIYYIEFYCFFFSFPCYIKITHFKLFIHFQTETNCRKCEVAFRECSCRCWAATQKQSPLLRSLERGVNSRALLNSRSCPAFSPAHVPHFPALALLMAPVWSLPGTKQPESCTLTIQF